MPKKNIWKKMMTAAGASSLLLSFLVIGVIFVSRIEIVKNWYAGVQAILLDIEMKIASIDDIWLFVFVIILLYILKSLAPGLTVSAMCMICGLVFPVWEALALNVSGILILFSVKYYIGRRFGGGRAVRLIAKNEKVRSVFEHSGKGNPWLLLVFRTIPSFPLNGVSRLYGGMGFRYWLFLLLSLLGYAPRLISYTFIGKNAFDPLSPAFLTPLAAVLMLSGLSLLFANALWALADKIAAGSGRRGGRRKGKLGSVHDA